MTGNRIRRTAAAVAVLTALGTLAACGGNGDDNGGKAPQGHSTTHPGEGGNRAGTDTLSQLRLAADRTDHADSAKVEGTTVVNKVTMKMNGELAWPHGMVGAVTIKMSGGPMAASLRQMGSDGTYRARYLPDAMYVDMGDAVAKTDGGKPWLKYGYDVLAKMLGASGSAMKDQFQNNNPTRSVQMLIGSGDVKGMGTETVRGVKATHYAGTVDVAKLFGAQSGLSASTAKTLEKQLQAQGVTTDHVDLWVDGHGLLVKKEERATTASGALDSTAYYSDYGIKVDVAPPAASQTMDVAELLAQQQAASS